jgi:hypothetical protein
MHLSSALFFFLQNFDCFCLNVNEIVKSQGLVAKIVTLGIFRRCVQIKKNDFQRKVQSLIIHIYIFISSNYPSIHIISPENTKVIEANVSCVSQYD